MRLVERDRELARLADLLGSCAAGHGGLAWVSGPAASGKTALLRAFGERAVRGGARYLQATASAAERELPLGVMGQLVLGAGLDPAAAEEAARLTQLAAVTARVRGAEDGIPADIAVSVLSRLCGILLEHTTRSGPLVISVDDVQHADDYSLECILYLTRRVEISPVLVVLGESTSFPPRNPRFLAELARLPGCHRVRLAPLSARGVADLLAAGGRGGRRTSVLATQLHRIGGGNPLLTRALLEDHEQWGTAAAAAARARPAGRSGETGETAPGEAYAQAVVECLHRGDVTLRRTACALAVLGPGTGTAELAALLGVPPDAVDRGLATLHAGGLLSGRWFRHRAGWAAVLAGMAPARRGRLEAGAARVLRDRGAPAAELARHLVLAEPVTAPWALAALLEAAERSLAADDVPFALDCLRTARDTCRDEGTELAVRAALVRASWRVNPAAGERDLTELAAAAFAGRLGLRDTRALAGQLLWFGRFEEALEVLGALRDREPGGGADRAGAGGTAGTAGAGGGAAGEGGAVGGAAGALGGAGAAGVAGPADVARALPGSLAGAPAGGPGESAKAAFARLWTAYQYPGLFGPSASHDVPLPDLGPGVPAGPVTPVPGGGRPSPPLLAGLLTPPGPSGDPCSRPRAAVERAEGVLQSTPLDDRTLNVLVAALVTLFLADELERAGEWCDALLKEAVRRRAPMWQAVFSTARSLVDLRLGRPTAERAAYTALTLLPPEGWGTAIAVPVAALLSAQTMRGWLGEAGAHLSVPVPGAAFHTPGGLLYLRARGHSHLAAGRPYAALDDFLTSGELMRRWALDAPALVPWRSDAAQVHLALGEPSAARALAEEQLALAGPEPRWARGVTLRALAAASEPARRRALLTEAVEIFRERGHRFELGGALRELARAHQELGDERQARVAVRRAQRLAGARGGAGAEAVTSGSAGGAAGGSAALGGGGRPGEPMGAEADAGAEAGAGAGVGAGPAGSGARPGERGADQRGADRRGADQRGAEQRGTEQRGADRSAAELSEAERRVATLAARGHTNRQIAELLFITVSTVEQHLTRAYRKLDVRSRGDLPRRLRAPEEDPDAGHPGPADPPEAQRHAVPRQFTAQRGASGASGSTPDAPYRGAASGPCPAL